MVRQLQQKGFGGRYSQTKISNPDFVKLAEAYGIPAVSVNNRNELYVAIKSAFAVNSPYIVNIYVEPEEII